MKADNKQISDAELARTILLGSAYIALGCAAISVLLVMIGVFH